MHLDAFIYNHALLNNLTEETEYVYRVGNEDGWSEYDTFTTPSSSESFSFLFAADPQIGAGEDIDDDIAGWSETLSQALDCFPDTQILLLGGDQVNSASNTGQYDGVLSPSLLTSLPVAAVVGNHDVGAALYSQHFAYSNVDENTITKSAGDYSGDYWFVRSNTLFMALNSNMTNTQDHINFMNQAILAAGDSIKWKVVMFHHSVFSTAGHSTNADIIARRESLSQAFTDLQIDLVLMGHDHAYCRTYMMGWDNPGYIERCAEFGDRSSRRSGALCHGQLIKREQILRCNR
jgi:predicted phosphodiesterase